MILTTHRMDEAESFCDNIVIMINGSFVCYDSPGYLKSQYGKGYNVSVKSKTFDQAQEYLNEKILKRILQKLKQLVVVHIHSNNMGGVTEKNDPKVIELTLVNKKYLGKKIFLKGKFKKHPNDFINDPMRKDIEIKFA